ncbi:MAG: LGFP repeat-containing protein [Mycobacterium sp.]|uniref:sunset domain-containing protein n=1 Tax=Mycobacterium sp. TaxID=1785 RepID=UPI001ED171FF|nr:hypothetical protein [Mycobacterium sp.]MBW0017880.1 LGFP repeat-containing protein [Mycobacterium sp.]
MSGQRGQVGKLVGRALVSLATTVAATLLLAPVAAASPIGDAEAAIMAAWEKAGGDTSTLGARKGDVYAVGDGFALDFANGKMFYTPDTGAKSIYGPILDKYESLGGPGGSDLGFPTINEIPGLAGPDSRVSTFSASDKPVIYWTPEHGAYVVRGAINTAWDRLGSSGGVLGVPVADESYDGEVTSQKFSGGQVSWNRQTKQFTTVPPGLADQLTGLQVVIDPTAAINMAWRGAGGATGPLGGKQGGEYPIGGDGVAQNFVGGKVFFSPATGANAVESDILTKYEALGGPVSSDLGFPTSNETDGGFGNASRISTFSGADKPVIFWTSDHGAFVVRGAMKAAWDKLRGPSGKLGAPVADQTIDGDVVSQRFTGGKITWDRAKNVFSTEPANLAPLLSGLQVPGQNQPSTSTMPAHPKKFAWHWWYLLAAVPLLVLAVLLMVVAFGWRRRRRADREGLTYLPDRDLDDDLAGYDAAVDGHWSHNDDDREFEHLALGNPHAAEHMDAGHRVSWPRGAGAATGVADTVHAGEEYDGDVDEGFEDLGFDDQDPDAVDTTPIASNAIAGYAGEAETPEPPDGPDSYLPEVVAPEIVVPEVAGPETDIPDVEFPQAEAPDFADVPAPVADAITGRHAAVESSEDAWEGAWEDARQIQEARSAPIPTRPNPAARPTLHLPLEDPYQAPDGYPIKASARSGLFYAPDTPLYHDTIAEIWFASEEVAQANGFIKAD